MREEPFTPIPLSPSQLRLRRSDHIKLIRRYNLSAPHTDMPAGILFQENEICHAHVQISSTAATFLNQSNDEGRKFPLALSEAFAIIDPLCSLILDMEQREDRTLFHITASFPSGATHSWYIDPEQITTIHNLARVPTFNALAMAHELVRLCSSE